MDDATLSNLDVITDVVISGGGAAGYSLAIALANDCPHLSVALIENHDPQQQKVSSAFDARLIALSEQSLLSLDRYSCSRAIREACTPIKHIQVSDRHHIGQCALHADEVHRNQLGGVIALEDLGNILHHHLPKTIARFQPDYIDEIHRTRELVNLTLHSGEQLSTKLLVIAEGAQSRTADLLSLSHETHDYGQFAVVANIGLDQPHHNWAYERFTTHGPIAMLPMAGNCASMVWCVDNIKCEQLMTLPQADFLQQLQDEFGLRMGRFTKLSQRFSYPLSLRRRHDAVSHRVAAVANSAQTLHPIAGQGFNLGLRDVLGLSQLLSQQDDPGAYSVLTAYRQCRSSDRDLTVAMTHGLVHMFSSDAPLLAAGRNIGLAKMAMSPILRNGFAQLAMGFRKGGKLL